MHKEKDKIETEIVVAEIYHCPHADGVSILNTISMLDNGNKEFIWSTLSKNYPEKGEIKKLTAKIAEPNISSHYWDKIAYKVSNCKFKKPE